MNASNFSRAVRALAISIVVAGVAGCGGGEAAPPDTQTLGPAAGSVSSSDGKVTVSVGANALQAPATITIVPATPDAATAADPSYVAGTTYTYTAPDLQVPEQVMITIDSPLAVSAEAAPSHSGREHALAYPAGYQPPPTCLINTPSGGPPGLVKNIAVAGTSCPQSPLPACVKIHQYGSTPPYSLCAPGADVVFVPANLDVCPVDYREVTNEPEFAELAAENGSSRICSRELVATPPVLGVNGARSNIPCNVSAGKFLCPAPKLPSGTLSIYWDKTPPPIPSFTLDNGSDGGTTIPVHDNQPAPLMRLRVHATDPQSLGGVVVDEIVKFTGPGATTNSEWQTVQRWHADAAQFEAAAPVTQYDSGYVVAIPYTLADKPTRWFRVRSFDQAGNSTSSTYKTVKKFTPTTSIESFTASPTTVPLPGGPVTLAWIIPYTGFGSVSIDNGVGSFTAANGSTTVNVTATTTFTLTLTSPLASTKTATATVTIGADNVPPTVAIAAAPTVVVAPGSTTLTATANDLAGVTKVEFYRGATLIGTDTTAPYTQAVAFTPADIGNASFTAKAFDAANNNTTSAAVVVAVGADTTPPTVSLLANPATVLVPGATTLQATVSDNIGVTKVEFWRGGTLIATDSAAPFQTQVDFTTADLGTVAFTAKAFDAQNNNTTGTAVNVLVTTPSSGDTYASPTGVDTGNTTCSQAQPCLSIAKAAALAQANKTVWLNNGAYSAASQPVPIQIPAGLTLRALTPGLAGIGQAIVLQGNATVVGIVLRRVATGDSGWIEAASGSVTIDGVKAEGPYFAGGLPPLSLSGTVQVTMTPGNIADYTDALPAVGQNSYTYAALSGSARLTVNGGVFGGAVLGGADGLYGGQARGAFRLFGSARLDLNNVQLNVDSTGVFMGGSATQLHLNGSTIQSNVNTGPGYAIHAGTGAAAIVLVNSTISGFRYAYAHNSRGILVGEYTVPGAAATLTMTNSAVTGNDVGIWAVHGTTPSTVTMTGSGASVSGNAFGGVVCYVDCAIDIASGQISSNGVTDPTLVGGVSDFYGGLWLASASNYQLKLRNVSVVDNKSVLGGNSNQPGNSGITMFGSASSTYDLGTAASPGNNLIQGNTTGSQTTGLNVNVAAGVIVSAVGNTFAAGVQGANAQGKYLLGAAPCSASSCNLTTGSGANYRVTSGTLRLAQ